MKKFDIWSEGFIVNEGRSGATYHDTIEASSFKEACDKYFGNDIYYNSKTLTYWGCKLFDNESDARKSFG